MSSHRETTTTPAANLLIDYSLEMTGKDMFNLRAAQDFIPPGTRVNVTFLGSESLEMRVAAARAVVEAGFVPVPHIAARRLASKAELQEFLEQLQQAGATDHVMIIGGDPGSPAGPYHSALDVIDSGSLEYYGVRDVGIAGYPEGHPDIPTAVLRNHLARKVSTLADHGLRATIVTQFSFDAGAAKTWIDGVRQSAVDAPIRIGAPGPAGIKRLLEFARRFGIGANAMIVKKYGFSLTNLIGTAGPERFVEALAGLLTDDPKAGDVKMHLYAFGGLRTTADWARDYRKKALS